MGCPSSCSLPASLFFSRVEVSSWLGANCEGSLMCWWEGVDLASCPGSQNMIAINTKLSRPFIVSNTTCTSSCDFHSQLNVSKLIVMCGLHMFFFRAPPAPALNDTLYLYFLSHLTSSRSRMLALPVSYDWIVLTQRRKPAHGP